MANLQDVNSDDMTITNNHDEPSAAEAAVAIGVPSDTLIVANIPEEAFVTDLARKQFEALFQHYDTDAEFFYLRSFRRARILFKTLAAATSAHNGLSRHLFNGHEIKCYYAQPPIETRDPANKFLEPPEPEKQFLISPPASPPVGWEVIAEREPYVNYDLINAIAQMGPGNSYKLHQGSDDQPAIVVHVCDDPKGFENRPTKIEQTRCPERKP